MKTTKTLNITYHVNENAVSLKKVLEEYFLIYYKELQNQKL